MDADKALQDVVGHVNAREYIAAIVRLYDLDRWCGTVGDDELPRHKLMIADGPNVGREFGGAQVILQGRRTLVRVMVGRLLSCGHAHNFAVALDGGRLYLSEEAVVCATAGEGAEGL